MSKCFYFINLTVIKLAYNKEDAKDSTPSFWYGICATTYLGAMLASNKALQWINYPTQVVVNANDKSLKTHFWNPRWSLTVKKYNLWNQLLFLLLNKINIIYFCHEDVRGRSSSNLKKGKGVPYQFRTTLLHQTFKNCIKVSKHLEENILLKISYNLLAGFIYINVYTMQWKNFHL